MSNYYTRKFYISSYDLNPRGQARLTSMANFFQELAYHHANFLGFGYHQMKERGTTWVLSRMRIRMNRYPLWNEEISIETWPSGIEKLFAMREFRISDSKGEVLGRASTAWLILDINTHRLVRPHAEFDRFKLIIEKERMFDSPLEKIAIPDDATDSARHKVVFSDLDILGHVNNVKYMEWCIDAAMEEGNGSQEIRDFEINFSHEALFGDEIVIGMIDLGRDLVFQGRREADGEEIFRASLVMGG